MSADAAWIRRFHFGERPVTAAGTLDVRRGTGWASRALAAALRFPPAGSGIAVRVRIERRDDGAERWLREIGGRRLDSVQRLAGDVLTERAGPAEIRMRLTVGPGGIELAPIGGALRIGALRIPLPRALAPHTAAVVTEGGGGQPSFEVDARIWVPSIGLLLAYRGHVHEEGTADG